jgi:hypothetical protein
MKVLVSLATLDQDSLIQTREENALATLANLSVQEEVGPGRRFSDALYCF